MNTYSGTPGQPLTPGQRSRAARDHRIVERAEAGESFAEIARDLDLSRERVRSIVAERSGYSARELEDRRESARRERRRTTILDLAQDPEMTVVELATRSDCTVSFVEETLGLGETLRRKSAWGRPGRARHELLDGIRQVAQRNAMSLSAIRYDNERGDRASSARILQVFGTWEAACREAGVLPGSTARGEYRRKWTEKTVLDQVAAYVADAAPDRPTMNGYRAWAAAHPSAPSVETVKLRAGSWTAAVRAVAHRFD